MMKTWELSGPDLDYWVARAIGWERIGKDWHTKPRHRPSKDYPGMIVSDWDGKGPHDFLISRNGQNRVAYCGCDGDQLPLFSQKWEDGGQIIEEYDISIAYNGEHNQNARWFAYCNGPETDNPIAGNTALVAAMRALVASQFGDEVEHK